MSFELTFSGGILILVGSLVGLFFALSIILFAREAPTLQPLPAVRYDTSYREERQVGWDAFVDVRGNRYAVPDNLVGQVVPVRITLAGVLHVYDGDRVAATHTLQPASEGWVRVPEYHAVLWREVLRVDHRDLSVYEEVAAWNS